MTVAETDFDVHPHFFACIHEAGHVVAARAFGFPVAWVSIDPEFTRTNQLAIENDAAAGNPVAMVRRKANSYAKAANSFVRERELVILALASELFQVKTLTSTQIDAILADPPKTIKIPKIGVVR